MHIFGEGDDIADFCGKRNSVVKTVTICGEKKFTVNLNLLTKQSVLNSSIRFKTTVNVYFKINASFESKINFTYASE